MAELTVSRQNLRRAICRKARMQFYLRYPAGYELITLAGDSDTASPSVNTVYCTHLTQNEGFWKGAYMWVMSSDGATYEDRRVVSFDAAADGLNVEWPLSSAPSTLCTFELLDMWPATQVHEAIDDAIADSWKVYPNIVEDESLIIEADKLSYDLTGFDKKPSVIFQVHVERATSGFTGVVTAAGGVSAVTDTAADMSAIADTTGGYAATDWRVSIYDGTGKGNHSEISAIDTGTGVITPSTAFSVAPDTTSSYRVWNVTKEESTWYRLLACKPSPAEDPSYLRLLGDYSSVYGLRLRITMKAQPETLAADSDETQVPKLYVMYKSLALLHDAMVGDNSKNSQRHAGLAEYYDQLARDHMGRNPRNVPAGTIWQEQKDVIPGTYEANPMGW